MCSMSTVHLQHTKFSTQIFDTTVWFHAVDVSIARQSRTRHSTVVPLYNFVVWVSRNMGHCRAPLAQRRCGRRKDLSRNCMVMPNGLESQSHQSRPTSRPCFHCSLSNYARASVDHVDARLELPSCRPNDTLCPFRCVQSVVKDIFEQ
jgi:hypothetical protein